MTRNKNDNILQVAMMSIAHPEECTYLQAVVAMQPFSYVLYMYTALRRL